MKLSCRQADLSKGLAIVGRAVATRTTLPITNNILLTAGDNQLKLAATNLEIAISHWLGAEVEQAGAITVPARLLTDFVSTLPSEQVNLAVSPRSRTLNLKCARFEGRINGIDAEEFPPIPSIQEGMTTKIACEALRTAIAQVVFAAATEETRPVLTGVHCQFSGETLTLAAADGFRLAVHKAPLAEPVAERTEVIVPARTLNELQRLIGDQEEPVEATVNPKNSQILFRVNDVEIVSQLIQGTFPNYVQLIPPKYTTRAEIGLPEFLKATKTTSIFAREGSAIVRLQVMPGEGVKAGKVVLSAKAEEIGDNVGEVDAVVEGEEAKIAFNNKFLADVLGVLRSDKVWLETTTPSSPGVIRPVGADNYIHVVMPMFVQW